MSSNPPYRRPCCRGNADSPPAVSKSRSIARRGAEIIGWILPAALLALFPKCPLCMAGYIALATGLGVSTTTAGYLRWTLLALCLASLAIMAARLISRRSAHRAI